MENASKALLIAAAVLVVILIIAFGMRILNSSTDVSGQAESVGSALESQAGSAASNAITAIQGTTQLTPSKDGSDIDYQGSTNY